MRRFERWLFAPGDPRRLAAVRIGLCAVLAERLSRDVYRRLADQPPALFRPISFMRVFSSMPARSVVVVLQVVGVAAAIMAAAGVRPRISLPVAWSCGLFLNGMATSVGKVVHNDVLLLLAMVPLLIAPSGEAWSVDSWRRRVPAPRASARFGWPVRTAMVVVAGAYFFTGLAKVEFSGLRWVSTDNLRWVLYVASDAQSRPNQIGLFVADRPWLAHLVAAGALVVELGFPLVLWRPKAAWFFLPGIVLLHAGIWVTMHLDYSAWIATAVIVLVNWPAVIHRFGTPRAVQERSTEAAQARVAPLTG